MNAKKLGLFIVSLLLLIIGAGCANEANGEGEVTLKVGASSVPHAEILEFIAPDLEKEGIQLDIVHSTDGIQTNQQTADKDLDANFFQHTPYLEQVNKDSGLDLVVVKGIHIEPFGVYSKEINAIGELSDGAQIAVPNNPSNFSRALTLFEENGIIELNPSKDGDYTLEDITKNEKNLKFVPVDPPLLVHSLKDVEASAINTNYALEADLSPLEDSLIIEDTDSPYVNVLVSRKDNQDSEAIQKLAEILTSDKVRNFIEDTYKGAVVPAF
ncbi:MetQ/NlpA family ABC transporter substrate-binding protein [Cytobacillus purgationiresistens]|uniref:Lipoprotein n=1 Tax=Cytobacillus purgationiresistens TaxID=863449 RepID=A0ABU0ABK7_9BACI|nr:MetQ/NlpA family ABC transporter substrate-binding protein [Cytobacillus purgationiresistens]MDQ0268177.1 D-methionine transport system substrate-binding protein [Cytobacillus purgationiresistens]